MERDAWCITVETGTTMTATKEQFRIDCAARAYEGERLRYDRRWPIRKPRNLV